MAWRRPGDKPLSEPMMASLLTHIRYLLLRGREPSTGVIQEGSQIATGS